MIEHGAATVPSTGSTRACDLVLLPELGVFALSAGGGRTGGWAARRCLEVVRRHAAGLASLADAVESTGPDMLEGLQALFDEAASALHEQARATGHATRGELGVVVVRPGWAWIGMSGDCGALIQGEGRVVRVDHAGGSLRLGRVPLGVHPTGDPELTRHRLGPSDTLVLGSSARLHGLGLEDAGLQDCGRLAQLIAQGLVGPRGEGAAIALRCGARRTAPDLLDAVATTRLLGGLDLQALRRLVPYLLERRLDADQPVFRAGDPGDRLYLVLGGSVRVHRGDTSLVTLTAGDHFGELALHLEGVRTASVTATSPLWLASLHRRHLRELEERRPDVAVALQRRLLAQLAGRVDDLTNRIVG